MSNTQHSDRNYRRGAIMGLTMAEAFVLICFALLLLFAFWQWEVEKENTPEVQAFKKLPYEQRQTVLLSSQDGSIEAFVSLKEKGMDFSTPSSVEDPQEKWRFIDEDELRRLVDAAESLPEDVQRDLADMVESNQAAEILQEMALLEELVQSSESVEELLEAGHDLEEMLQAARILEALAASGQTVGDLLATVEQLDELEDAGQTLEGISRKIRDAEVQEAALVGALKTELGDLVADIGGYIDDTGAIILPEKVIFQKGKSTISPSLGKFLAQACHPWLSTLKSSGVDISEVKIEGHASSDWNRGTSPTLAYVKNLNLSQLRSQAVLRFCLDFVKDKELLDWSRKHLIAVGYSSARPVLKDGEEDKEASRRVVFSVTPNRKSLLEEIETEAKIARYDRSLFRGWADSDGDCQNTRHELLQSLSTGIVTLAANNCTVTRGKWIDPYTGQTFTLAKDVEVDHLVPLKWAWDRGAHSWMEGKRIEFANDPANLFVVAARVNQSKAAKGPNEWLPPSSSFKCQYMLRFLRVVQKFDLQVPAVEMKEMDRLKEEVCN